MDSFGNPFLVSSTLSGDSDSRPTDKSQVDDNTPRRINPEKKSLPPRDLLLGFRMGENPGNWDMGNGT